MQFDLPKDKSSIIKVIGVGGGGSNAVNHMYRQGIKGVDFIVCNTDNQALDISPVPTKVQLGTSLTEGRGAGSIPDVGKNAAIEDIEAIRELLGTQTKMVFVTAGMGGGTGTGAAPVIAATAKEMGILTVGIVTMPFVFEGRKRREQADRGIQEMRDVVDTLLVINNNKLREMYGNLTLADAFAQADDVLTTAAKGIAEIITVTGSINVDFEDVKTVMTDSGVAIMGSAVAEGDQRSIDAVEKALASPLLNDNNIRGARYVLLNITYGTQEPLMDEIGDITDFIQEESGGTADVIWGHGQDEELGDKINVTIIATGFNMSAADHGLESEKKVEKRVMRLDEEPPQHLTHPQTPEQNKPEPKPEPAPQAGPRITPDGGKRYTLTDDVESPYETNNNTSPQPTPAPQPEPEVVPEPIFRMPEPQPVQDEVKEEDVPEPFLKQSPAEADEDPLPSASQHTIEFDLSQPPVIATDEVEESFTAATEEPASEEPTIEPYLKSSPVVESSVANEPPTPTYEEPRQEVSPQDQQRRANDRIMRLKDLSSRLKTPSGISELENEPAYRRRNVDLDDTPHSSESQVSRYTLSEEVDEDGEKRTGLRPNNPFLHDNVD